MSHISLYCPKINIELPEKCQGKTWSEQAKFLTELAIPFINGIPVDQFISTEERLPLNIIDRCHTQGERLAVQDPSDPHFQFFRQILGQLAAGLSIPDEYVKR